MVEPFYFGQETRRLFGVLHDPASRARTGLVFCPPYGEEMVASYAHVSRWSKELVNCGFAVLRYHPFGMGESDGMPSDFTLESALEDAMTAVRCLRERAAVQRVGLVGLRFGGYVATEAALSCRADFLVLWSPIINPRLYCRDLLRMQLTKELVHQHAKEVRVTTREMIGELEAGRPVDILGYDLSPEFYRQMNSHRGWSDRGPVPEALWLSRQPERMAALPLVERWRERGSQVDFRTFDEPAFWEDWEFGFPQKFAKASTDWLALQAGSLMAAS